MAKPTYSEIAHRAGVGTATVERVLNGRGGVRPPTVEKVLVAARELDWPGRLPDRHRGVMRIEVILVRPETSFYNRLSKAFRRIASTLDPLIQLHISFLDEFDGEAIARRITDRSARRSALVISTPDHPAVRDAILLEKKKGIPVVQVVTRTLPELDFVGIDNYAAGRMAAMLLVRMGQVRGKVAALCHSQVYMVHRERIRGFSDYMRDHPVEGLSFDYLLFGHDDRDTTADRMIGLVRQWPDLVGLYNAGGANTGVLDALAHTGRDIFFVGHEVNDTTARALRGGQADVMLDQLPETQARRAIDIILSRLGVLTDPVENPPIRFTTVTVENL